MTRYTDPKVRAGDDVHGGSAAQSSDVCQGKDAGAYYECGCATEGGDQNPENQCPPERLLLRRLRQENDASRGKTAARDGEDTRGEPLSGEDEEEADPRETARHERLAERGERVVGRRDRRRGDKGCDGEC